MNEMQLIQWSKNTAKVSEADITVYSLQIYNNDTLCIVLESNRGINKGQSVDLESHGTGAMVYF